MRSPYITTRASVTIKTRIESARTSSASLTVPRHLLGTFPIGEGVLGTIYLRLLSSPSAGRFSGAGRSKAE